MAGRSARPKWPCKPVLTRVSSLLPASLDRNFHHKDGTGYLWATEEAIYLIYRSLKKYQCHVEVSDTLAILGMWDPVMLVIMMLLPNSGIERQRDRQAHRQQQKQGILEWRHGVEVQECSSALGNKRRWTRAIDGSHAHLVISTCTVMESDPTTVEDSQCSRLRIHCSHYGLLLVWARSLSGRRQNSPMGSKNTSEIAQVHGLPYVFSKASHRLALCGVYQVS